MRVSLVFTGFAPIASTLPAVHAAERHGLDGVWSAEHIGFHDAIAPSLLYLRETERLEIGLVGFCPRAAIRAARDGDRVARRARARAHPRAGRHRRSIAGREARQARPRARALDRDLRAALRGRSGSDVNVEYPTTRSAASSSRRSRPRRST
jgi:hypothetical protein